MFILYRSKEVLEDVSNASGFTRRLDDTTRGATERFDPWNFGIAGLDEMIRGVRAGFVNLIAARPHCGKTLLALAGIRNTPDRPTLFISADDDPEVVVRKMMQFDGIVADGWKAKPEQMVAYVEENYPNLDIVDNVNWGPVKVNGRLTVSEAIEQYGNEMGQAPELIVYDYLGIDGLDYARTVEISGWQKELCRTLPMPVLILAQASREKSKWEKNQSGDNVRRGFRMEDMMFGGEQQAGLIIGLTRGERLVMGMLQSIIEVDVVKNKAVFDGSGLTNPTDPIILCHHEGRLVDKKTLEARLSAAEDYAREEARRGYFQ